MLTLKINTTTWYKRFSFIVLRSVRKRYVFWLSNHWLQMDNYKNLIYIIITFLLSRSHNDYSYRIIIYICFYKLASSSKHNLPRVDKLAGKTCLQFFYTSKEVAYLVLALC